MHAVHDRKNTTSANTKANTCKQSYMCVCRQFVSASPLLLIKRWKAELRCAEREQIIELIKHCKQIAHAAQELSLQGVACVARCRWGRKSR